MTSDAQLLFVSDAAKVLGISEASVRALANTGRLPCWRTTGGYRIFTRADVDAFVANPQATRHANDSAA